jgi:hypothetical protein
MKKLIIVLALFLMSCDIYDRPIKNPEDKGKGIPRAIVIEAGDLVYSFKSTVPSQVRYNVYLYFVNKAESVDFRFIQIKNEDCSGLCIVIFHLEIDIYAMKYDGKYVAGTLEECLNAVILDRGL